MFRRKVNDPHGRKWTLGRHWLPRRKRFEKANVDMPNSFGDIGGDDTGIFAAILLAIGLFFLAFVTILLLFNVVALAIELTIVIVVGLATLIGRIVFRRPWIVFARSGENRIEYPVVGYFNSRRRIDELAGQLSSGAQLPPGHR